MREGVRRLSVCVLAGTFVLARCNSSDPPEVEAPFAGSKVASSRNGTTTAWRK